MDIELSLAVGGPGYPGGTFIFSAMAENMEQFRSQEAKLAESAAFVAASEKAAPLSLAPVENRLRAAVTMAPTEPPDIALGATISVFTAQMRGSALAQAMQFGSEITDYVHRGTGLPIAMFRNVTGNVSELAWISIMPTPADVDKSLEWEASDAGYQERYAAAGDLFAEGSAHRGFITRIA